MTGFWLLALCLMALAVGLLIIPLVRRAPVDAVDGETLSLDIYQDKLRELENDLNIGVINQQQYDQAIKDVKRSLVTDLDGGKTVYGESRGSTQAAIVIAVAVPILAMGMYFILDRPSMDKVEKQQADTNYWMQVARVYYARGQTMDAERMYEGAIKRAPTPEASTALKADYANFLNLTGRTNRALGILEKLVEKGAGNADVLSHLVDVLATRQGGFKGRPAELIQQALKMQPNHPKTLNLAGFAAMNERDFATAIKYWEKLLAVSPGGAPTVQKNIEQARAMMKNPQLAEQMTKGARVSGKLSIAKNLLKQVAADDTVYLFARAVKGPRFPLAVVRLRGKDLPMDFTLDESHAMDANQTLAKYQQVIITARVAKGGDAIPKPGDLEGHSRVVNVGSEGVEVVINGAFKPAHRPMTQRTSPQPQQQPPMGGGTGGSISGTLSLAPALNGKASPDDVVFIFAKAVGGPPMPLAVVRKKVKDLPLKFTLDDSSAMNPQMTISKFPNVLVTARISKSGNALQQSGDLTSASEKVKLGSNDLKLEIKSVIP